MGATSVEKTVADEDLFPIPVRPAWCKDCSGLCLAEDIEPLRVFEEAYGAVRRGLSIEYPTDTVFRDPAATEKNVAAYLGWRMGRRHPARALCCGGANYQFMDVAQPLLKHAECDFGFIEPGYFIGGYIPRPPGIHEPANVRIYTPEGELFCLLTWYKRDEDIWEVAFTSYPPVLED